MKYRPKTPASNKDRSEPSRRRRRAGIYSANRNFSAFYKEFGGFKPRNVDFHKTKFKKAINLLNSLTRNFDGTLSTFF